MLTLLAALALAAPLPQETGPVQEPAPVQGEKGPPRKQPGVVHIGSPSAKFQGRKFLIRDLGEAGGQTLIDRYRLGIGWCVNHLKDTSLPEAEDGRVPGLSGMLALLMLGESSAVTGGAFRFTLRSTYLAMREMQDAETGAFAKPGSSHFAFDQALATQAMCEIVFSDGKRKQIESAERGVSALLAARGEDGLWRLAGGSEGAADPLTTSLAAHALFAAVEARLEVPGEVFDELFAWTERAPAGEGGIDTMSILATRLFAAEASGKSLKDDARTSELTRLVAARVPAMEAGAELPAIVTDPVHAYLATLTLVQADAEAFQRLTSWLHGPFLVEQQPYGGEEAGSFPEADNGAFPKGRLATACLRMLAIENQRRELPFDALLD